MRKPFQKQNKTKDKVMKVRKPNGEYRRLNISRKAISERGNIKNRRKEIIKKKSTKNSQS